MLLQNETEKDLNHSFEILEFHPCKCYNYCSVHPHTGMKDYMVRSPHMKGYRLIV